MQEPALIRRLLHPRHDFRRVAEEKKSAVEDVEMLVAREVRDAEDLESE